MSKLFDFSPDYIVKPGETIVEMLEELSMTQKELAARMNITEKTVVDLIKGASPITQKYAKSLEAILGLPYTFWINLQRDYDDAIFLRNRKQELIDQVDIAKSFPKETLKKMNLLPKGRISEMELVEKLLSIFKVQNLNQVITLYEMEFDCKIADRYPVDEYAIVTWMRLGELEAIKDYDYQELPSFDGSKLISKLDSLKVLNLETNPELFLNELKQLCKGLGIIFVVVPEIKGSRISGMARWLKVGKRKIPMIQLSLRGKKHDMFWFTFFHELGHIYLHKNETYLDLESGEQTSLKEQEADEFSRDTLISKEDYEDCVQELSETNYSPDKVGKMAQKLEIHPGILVGRLQKDEHIGWNRLNYLKTTYKWEFEN